MMRSIAHVSLLGLPKVERQLPCVATVKRKERAGPSM